MHLVIFDYNTLRVVKSHVFRIPGLIHPDNLDMRALTTITVKWVTSYVVIYVWSCQGPQKSRKTTRRWKGWVYDCHSPAED